MSPNQEQQDSSHSSDSTSEATVVPSHTDIPGNRSSQRPVSSSSHRVSSRPKSSTGHKISPVEVPYDSEALVVTDLEDEEPDSFTADGLHGCVKQGEVNHKEYVWSYHDAPATHISREGGHQLSDTATSPHSLDGDDEPEVW